MLEIVLYINLFLCLMNLLLLFFIGTFLVRFRDRVNGLFLDFTQVMERLFNDIPSNIPVEKYTPRTWDEKYEYDLFVQSRRRSEGLDDLPDPTISWGQPPQPTNQPDLQIKDKI